MGDHVVGSTADLRHRQGIPEPFAQPDAIGQQRTSTGQTESQDVFSCR